MVIDEAKEQFGDAEFRNLFDSVNLGNGFSVVVPNLVQIGPDGIDPLFDINVKRWRDKGKRFARLLASCREFECNKVFIDDDKDPTTVFRVKAGKKLSEDHFPGVRPHIFSLIGLGLGHVPDLIEEVYDNESVGLIIDERELPPDLAHAERVKDALGAEGVYLSTPLNG